MSESQKQFDPLQPPVVSPQPPPHTPFDPSLQKTLLKIYRIAAIIFVSLFFLGAAIVGVAYWRASVLRQQAWAEMQEDEKAQREAAIQWQKEEEERQKKREEESRKRQEAYRIAQAEREAAAEKYRAERAKRDAQKALEEERRKKERDEEQKKRDKRNLRFDQIKNVSSISRILREVLADRGTDQTILDGIAETKLSWRVQLLPSLGLNDLYSSFNHSEPWDSEHNTKLLSKMPEIFGSDPASGLAEIRTLLPLDGASPGLVRDITDPHDSLMSCFTVAGTARQPWTQPEDQQPLPDLVSYASLGFNNAEDCIFAGLDVSFLPARFAEDIDIQVFQALATHQGQEIFFGLDRRNTSLNRLPEELFFKFEDKSAEKNRPQVNQSDMQQHLETLNSALTHLFADMNAMGREHPANQPGKLSWRVHVLPYLGRKELYKKFNPSEHWNSITNIEATKEMPEVFGLGSKYGFSRVRMAFKRTGSSMRASGLPGDLRYTKHKPFLYWAAASKMQLWTKPNSIFGPMDELRNELGYGEGETLATALVGGGFFELPPDFDSDIQEVLRGYDLPFFLKLGDIKSQNDQELLLQPFSKPASRIFEAKLEPNLAASTSNATITSPKREAALRKAMQTINLAILNYYEKARRMPGVAKKSDSSPSGLSWRVHILPYLGEEELYNKFNLEEDWDSETNFPLLKEIPSVYRTVRADPSLTTFVAPGTPIAALRQLGLSRIRDGLQNTLMFIETETEKAVQWTKPDEVNEEETVLDITGTRSCAYAITAASDFTPIHRLTPDAAYTAFATAARSELLQFGTFARWQAELAETPYVSIQQKNEFEMRNLNLITNAMVDYAESNNSLPIKPFQFKKLSTRMIQPATHCLSWRVRILPFLGHHQLFSAFRLNESWDSPHNIRLLKYMPDCYRRFDAHASESTTSIQVCRGAGSPFPTIGKPSIRSDIKDGPANTIAILILPKEMSVSWTKPDDYSINLANNDCVEQLATLLKASPEGLRVGFLNADCLKLPADTTPETLRCFLTRDAGDSTKQSLSLRKR